MFELTPQQTLGLRGNEMADNVIDLLTQRARRTNTRPATMVAAHPAQTRVAVLLVASNLETARFLMKHSRDILPDSFTLTIDAGTPVKAMPYMTFDVVVLDSGFSGDDINAHAQEARGQKRDVILFGMRLPGPSENIAAFSRRLIREIDEKSSPTPAA